MHTVERLEYALDLAEKMGYQVRHEWLGGTGGGVCEFGGRKWVFVDLALNAIEQFDQVAEGLLSDPAIHIVDMPVELRAALDLRRSA